MSDLLAGVSRLHTLQDICVSVQEKMKTATICSPWTHPGTNEMLSSWLKRRRFCDKALSWVNNEWDRPISSKFDGIFCFLNMKEDRSSQGNELFSTGSHSLLSTSQLINSVKSTQKPRHQMQVAVCFLCHMSCSFAHCRWPCARGHSLVCM